ncbi:zinc ribbon domain-containing protein [Pirellulaceae bacterium SH501]
MRVDESPILPPVISPENDQGWELNRPDTELPCSACGSPRQPGARFCTACGIPLDQRSADGTQPSKKSSDLDAAAGEFNSLQDSEGTSFHCDNCGADVDVPRGGNSLRCPFCDSTYVVELPAEKRRTLQPEFVIGFAITREKALELFFEWLGKNSWFRPGDLKARAFTDKQQGVYLPFWHFSMIADSRWQAQIGEYWYRTETYRVKNSKGQWETRTRQVRETEWWPLSGEYRKYYSGYMVSASKGLPHAEALKIQPYQLTHMMRYRPHYLAGWMVEEYSVSKEEALATTTAEFRERERRGIASFLPGDTYQGLVVSTDLDVGGTDLVLLPVHILTYRYRDHVYRFLVNGQTGKMVGEKPWSKKRITAAVIAGAILILVLITLVILLTHPRIGD